MTPKKRGLLERAGQPTDESLDPFALNVLDEMVGGQITLAPYENNDDA